MSKIASIVAVLLVCLFCRIPGAYAQSNSQVLPFTGTQNASSGTLWINLTSAEPHRALMALQMAEYAVSAKHPVVILLNVDAVKLAYSSKDAKTKKDNKLKESPQEALARLISQGATVMLCPHCIEYAKLDKDKRLPNTILATPSELLNTLFDSGTKTISY